MRKKNLDIANHSIKFQQTAKEGNETELGWSVGEKKGHVIQNLEERHYERDAPFVTEKKIGMIIKSGVDMHGLLVIWKRKRKWVN